MRLRGIVHGADEKPRFLRAGAAQQIRAGRVAEEGFHPEAAQRFDPVGIVIEHGDAEAIGAQQPADDVAEAAEAGEDHRVVVLVDCVGFALAVFAR